MDDLQIYLFVLSLDLDLGSGLRQRIRPEKKLGAETFQLRIRIAEIEDSKGCRQQGEEQQLGLDGDGGVAEQVWRHRDGEYQACFGRMVRNDESDANTIDEDRLDVLQEAFKGLWLGVFP